MYPIVQTLVNWLKCWMHIPGDVLPLFSYHFSDFVYDNIYDRWLVLAAVHICIVWWYQSKSPFFQFTNVISFHFIRIAFDIWDEISLQVVIDSLLCLKNGKLSFIIREVPFHTLHISCVFFLHLFLDLDMLLVLYFKGCINWNILNLKHTATVQIFPSFYFIPEILLLFIWLCELVITQLHLKLSPISWGQTSRLGREIIHKPV